MRASRGRALQGAAFLCLRTRASALRTRLGFAYVRASIAPLTVHALSSPNANEGITGGSSSSPALPSTSERKRTFTRPEAPERSQHLQQESVRADANAETQCALPRRIAAMASSSSSLSRKARSDGTSRPAQFAKSLSRSLSLEGVQVDGDVTADLAHLFEEVQGPTAMPATAEPMIVEHQVSMTEASVRPRTKNVVSGSMKRSSLPSPLKQPLSHVVARPGAA